MHSNYCSAESFVYLDKMIYYAIYRSRMIEFARSMYEFNVINKDIYETMTKLGVVLNRRQTARVLSELLMEVINNPKGYNIFKESLKKKNSLTLKRLYHQINCVG